MSVAISKSDFTKICRTCLKFDNNKISIYMPGVIDIFQSCTNLQVNESDNLPNFICLICYDKINEFYTFKLKCKQFDRKLREILQSEIQTAWIKSENVEDTKNTILCDDNEHNDDNEQFSEPLTEETKSEHDITDIDKSIIADDLNEKQATTDRTLFRNDLKKEPISDDCSENVDITASKSVNLEINVEDTYNDYIEKRKKKELRQSKREKYLTPDKCDTETLICKICDKKLATIHCLLRHIERHDASRSFQYFCSICNKGCYEKGQLTKHMRRHKGETRYNCEECSKPFYDLSALAVHMRQKHDAKPISCTICNKEFIVKLQYDNHMETHRVRQTHTCEQCGKTFPDYWKLKSHQLKHSNERAFTCHVCCKSFKEASALKKHQVKYHTEEKRNNYVNCTICEKLITAENLKSHMTRCHSTERPFQCNECSRCYATKQLLNLHHRDKHERKKPPPKKEYLCPGCGKQLSSATILQIHQRMHSDEKPYSCQYCNKTYKYEYALKMHLKIHGNERPHECNVCRKRFRQSTTLKIHLRIHTGERPFSCQICDKRFSQRSTLKTHMKVHEIAS